MTDLMETQALPTHGLSALPALRTDPNGRARVDQRSVFGLAVPLMVESAVQIAMSLTDMWFVGHISTKAIAAIGAVQLLIIVVMCVLGGVVVPVQGIVAQCVGARSHQRASQAAWTSLWATLCVAPLFLLVANASHLILSPFGLDPSVQRLASEFWLPRVSGSLLGVAVWGMLGFFNGIGRTRITLLVSVVTALANIPFNALFIFKLGWGIAGSGWATTAAQACGLLLSLFIFLGPEYRRQYDSHRTWKLHPAGLLQQLRMGVPMGLLPAADYLGIWLFQIMQVRLGTASGAASQITMMLISIAFMPGMGIASAGTTLVGESIGAGDRDWARRVGTRVIVTTMLYMAGTGLALALLGPWLLPLFTAANDTDSAATVAFGVQLLWMAAAYQLFDGLYVGASHCLRGAGDAVVPTVLALPVSALIFVPLAHSFTFAPGQGWVDFLPQFGWGVVGGWGAVVIYVMLLGTTLFLRWRSRGWQQASVN
jgi:multidrug resistance protein, MATE family